jgi:hypothetical protein
LYHLLFSLYEKEVAENVACKINSSGCLKVGNIPDAGSYSHWPAILAQPSLDYSALCSLSRIAGVDVLLLMSRSFFMVFSAVWRTH